MLASLKPLLLDAQKGKYAVGAFNVLNLEYAVGLVRAAELEKSPIILQISPSIIALFGLRSILDPCLALANQSKVPVCVHLDHGKTRQEVVDSINAGFSSVMFDGSSLSLQKNMEETSFLVNLAHQKSISIEAEIGKVGKEEDEQSDSDSKLTYTKIEDVLLFSRKVSIDALAVSIGSIHGVKNPHVSLDIDLLSQINQVVSIPLVLHGSSGVTDISILSAIQAGITKINVATRLKVRVAHALYILGHVQGESGFVDSKILSNTIIDSVMLEATSRIQLFNSLRK
jgi:fructose-bisphosphate aldolase class II